MCSSMHTTNVVGVAFGPWLRLIVTKLVSIPHSSYTHNDDIRTKSSGVTIVCVGPHAIIPPIVHAAK
jgi:hypothetical protein